METGRIMDNVYVWLYRDLYSLRVSLLAGFEIYMILITVILLQNELISVNSQGGSSYWGDSYCTYDRRILQPGDILKLDPCTSCRCEISAIQTSVIQCDIQSCPPCFCPNPVLLEDQCCEVCPYYVPVYALFPENLRIVRGWEYLTYHLELDLLVGINQDGQNVKGDRLWRVGMWASANEDGSGIRVAEDRQVLTEEQESARLDRPLYFGAFNDTITDVRYALDAISNEECYNVSYICVEFSKGDDAQQYRSKIPFIVVGVESVNNGTEVPSNLIKCLPYPLCEASDDYEGIWSTTMRPTTLIKIEGACYPPKVPANGYVDPNDYYYNYGQRVSIHCLDGFQLVGYNYIVCIDTGDWFGKMPKCVPKIVTQETPTLPSSTNITNAHSTLPTEATSVKIHRLHAVKGKTVNYIRVDLQVPVRARANHESGPLRVKTWASNNPTGLGNRIGYSEQILRPEEDMTMPNLSKPLDLSTTDLVIPGFNLTLDASNTTCDDIKYLCASLASHYLSASNVTNFVNDTNALQSDLIGCQPISVCEDPDVRGCVIHGGDLVLPGDVVDFNECTVCLCKNESTISCDVSPWPCPTTFCEMPVKFEDECCGICPNNVNVYKVDILGVNSVEEGSVNNINVTLQVGLYDEVLSVQGTGLWKLSIWAASVENCTGRRIGFTDQVLSEKQASKNLTRHKFDGNMFAIHDVKFALDTFKASCEELRYLCASFNMGEDPKPQEPGSRAIPFNVNGVEGANDSTPNPSRLVGRESFTTCIETSYTTMAPTTMTKRGCFSPYWKSHIFILTPHKRIYPYFKEVELRCGRDHELRVGDDIVQSYLLRCAENGSLIGAMGGISRVRCWYKAAPTTDKPAQVCSKPTLYNESTIIPDKEMYSLDERAQINCTDGLSLVGNHSIICGSNGTWLGKIPLCSYEGCLTPVVSNDSAVVPDKEWYTFGENATVLCLDELHLVGNNILICRSNGSWIGELPHCIPNGCSRPSVGNESVIIPGKEWYSFGQVIKVQINCTNDMQLHGDESLVCTDNRTWFGDIPYCLPRPTQISTPASTTRRYGKGCSRPNIANEGAILPEEDWYQFGEKVMVKCKADHYLVGDEILICSDVGMWYKELPKCLPKVKVGAPKKLEECHRPDEPLGGILSPDGTVFFPGQTLHINCKDGYRLVGEDYIVCSSTGSWHAAIGQCQYVPTMPNTGCRRPSVSYGGFIHPNKNQYDHGEKAQFNCSSGFRLVGDKVLVCDDTGSWHKAIPICEANQGNVLTPAVLTLCSVGLLLLALLIFLNCVSEGYKTPQPKLIHRVRRRNALNKMMANNNNHTRTRPPGHAEKCNGIA
ncbi:uncharacterized protein [Amphiura filiformis]|uniref:uncharacterized protein isoform X2 n=1 Tax=Amphiura filiformis TaxID=82378 RepID=UPI003B21847C